MKIKFNKYSYFFSITFVFFPLKNVLAECGVDIPRNKPDVIYKDYNNGTVLDTKTRLIWQKCSLGQVYNGGICVGSAESFTWGQAIIAVKIANETIMFGHNDWRIPNAREMDSLTEYACYGPSINESIFPNTPINSYYWTSTPASIEPVSINYGRVYVVGSASGGFGPNTKSSSALKVRLVRDIK